MFLKNSFPSLPGQKNAIERPRRARALWFKDLEKEYVVNPLESLAMALKHPAYKIEVRIILENYLKVNGIPVDTPHREVCKHYIKRRFDNTKVPSDQRDLYSNTKTHFVRMYRLFSPLMKRIRRARAAEARLRPVQNTPQRVL